MTPFTQLLMQARGGAVADRLTEELKAVVEGIDKTGKAGELTLKIKISPEKVKGSNAKDFEFDVAAKIPREALPKAIFYSNAEGDLFRTDPAQTEMRFEDAEERRARN